MRHYDSISNPHTIYLATLLFILLGLSACATTSSPDAITDSAATTATENTSSPTSENNPATIQSTDTEPTMRETDQVEPEPTVQETPTSPAEIEPVTIDVPCKNSPYSKYEKQARDSIAKGLSATTAGTYGVGFRNLDEHKKWNDTHKALFTATNQACSALSECAKQHPKDKTTQCAAQAKHFDAWQSLAARFAEKAKQSETTQPPKICSFSTNIADAPHCFHSLADNIDDTCTTGDCKKTSNCWRSIGLLDEVINQATSACTFVHTPLTECGGYVTATQRRENKFSRCVGMQKNLNIRIIPVL